MAHHNHMNVVKLYQSVIEDVISNVRENFLDDGVDEQVLQELKQLWESKVLSSKAVEPSTDTLEPQPPQLLSLMTKGTAVGGTVKSVVAGGLLPSQGQLFTPVTAVQNTSTGTNSLQQQQTQQTSQQLPQTQQTVIVTDPNKQVPVQITLPPPAGMVTIHVPVSALQGNALQSSLNGTIITAAMALPTQLATSLLQQHVTAALQAAAQPHQQVPRQLDGQDDSDSDNDNAVITIPIRQFDGPNDSSDEEEEDVDEDDDNEEEEDKDDHDEDENEDEANGGQEEEPLNSGDDVSDEEDPSDLFDTDNVIVCQYDKITRTRNKWKFYLKDGIMNLNGKDFVFQKSNGDAEW